MPQKLGKLVEADLFKLRFGIISCLFRKKISSETLIEPVVRHASLFCLEIVLLEIWGKSVSCFSEIFFWVTNQFVSEPFVCNTNPVVPRCTRVT